MSTPNDNPVSNASGKNHSLAANITICSADDAEHLFHRIAFGPEPTSSGGPSSDSAGNPKPFSNATATSQAEGSVSKAVRKRRSAFMNNDDPKRIRSAMSDLTVKESSNRAPVAWMRIDEPGMVQDGGSFGLEKGIFREGGRTDDELDSAGGLLRLSAGNSSHEQWAIEVVLELGKSLRWSLLGQPNGETQMDHQKTFSMVVAGYMGNTCGLKSVYTQRVRAHMSCMSSDRAAARDGMVLPERIEDIVATLRDAPFENRIIVVCDSDWCSLFVSLLLGKIQKEICTPGTSTWPAPETRLFPLFEELLKRVKGGQEVKFGGIMKGGRVMTSPLSFGRLGVIDFETFEVVLQGASD